MGEQGTQRHRFRPRISLLSALLLMTIVGLMIVVAQLWREVGPLRAEVAQLRNETGRLSVDDPTKIHAIQVNTGDELTWKWRVWIPKGRMYVVRGYGDGVPKEGFPKDGGTMRIREPGEHVITYDIDRDRTSGKWFGKTTMIGTGSVGKDDQSWVTWPSQTSLTSGVSTTAKSFDMGERVEIIRRRVSQAGDSSKIEDPAAGFMIWLEPASGWRNIGPTSSLNQ
jgi:hypothetical protein